MSLLPKTATLGLDPTTGEPFYWRGWSDSLRCMDARHYVLRGSPMRVFEGTPVAHVAGRERAPFKLIPRYVDLTLYRTSEGTYVCHRRWVSEAMGELPVIYDWIDAPDLEAMRDVLLNYDPSANAVTIWPEDEVATMRRAKRAKAWISERYNDRVRMLLAAGVAREQA